MSDHGPGFWRQSWLVVLLSLLFGGALAAVEITLAPRIKENKRNWAASKIPVLVPGAVKETSSERQLGGKTIFAACDEEGRQVGWVAYAAGPGFADRIEVLIGVDLAVATITGIQVLDQKETPGLGDFITSRERFSHAFEGQPTVRPLTVVKRDVVPGSGEVKALTGATISSESVAAIVNRRVAELAAELAAGGSQS